MAEMAYAGEYHGGAEAIGGVDDLLVAKRAARLNEGCSAVAGGFFHAIGEREECVGSDDAALERKDSFHRSELDGIDAAHLSGADGERLTSARVDDGVRFDVL